MFDITVIGDTTLDTFLTIESEEAKLLCQKEMTNCQLCFELGAKIPLAAINEKTGGNAWNVANALVKLGLKTSLVTTIGTDQRSRHLASELKQRGIGIQFLRRSPQANSNHSMILVFQGERTILTHHHPLTYHLAELSRSPWFYLTSLGPGADKFYPTILKIIEHQKGSLIFQPGTYQLSLGLGGLQPILSKSQIFIANTGEYQKLVGKDKQSEKELLKAVYQQGVKVSVMTEGDQGAWAYDGQRYLRIKAWTPRPIIEPTGAGDAFGATFVAALISGKNTETALLWGIINSGSVVEYLGADTGQLTKPEIQRLEKDITIPRAEIVD